MNHTLDQVDQEEKKKRSGGPKQHWTAVQYLERLETQLRLWRKRRRMERAVASGRLEASGPGIRLVRSRSTAGNRRPLRRRPSAAAVPPSRISAA